MVAAGTLTSRVLGLFRDQTLAAVFSRAETDAFFVAFTIPNVLRQLLAEGAVQNAVLPVMSKTKTLEGDDATREFFSAVRGISLVVLLAVTVAGVAFAPTLVGLFAAGYRDTPGQFERTVTLTRWVFPYIFFMGTAALGLAALNTYKRFFVTAFAPALLNVAFIACALLLPTWLGARGHERTLALAVGVLLGGTLQVVAQWPSLRKIGFLSRPRIDLKHPGVRDAMRRMVPVLFGIGVYYIDVLLARRFLSELGVGAQSYFAWALRLCDFPQGIFVMALQAATLPSLSALVAGGQQDEVSKTFAYGMRLALFVGIASTALFVALAEPLVIAIFQRGAFDAKSSSETARALVAQGAGIWMVAAVRQCVAVYYSMGDTRTPVIVSALDLCMFITLALTLRGPMGHVGISLAVTGAALVQLTLLMFWLRRRIELRFSEIAASALRTAVSAAAAGAVAYLSARQITAATSDGPIARVLPGIGGAMVFGLVFLAAAWLTRSPELLMVVEAVRKRRARA